MKIGYDSNKDTYFIVDLTDDEAVIITGLCQMLVAEKFDPKQAEIGERALRKKGKLSIITCMKIAKGLCDANIFKRTI